MHGTRCGELHGLYHGGRMTETVLVACPVHECKAYAVQRWIDNVNRLTYRDKVVLVADNSPTDEWLRQYDIPYVHVKVPQEKPYNRIAAGMEAIRQMFLGGPYTRWMS